MNTGFGANQGSWRRLQSARCRPSEKNRQRVRRDGRSGRSHRARCRSVCHDALAKRQPRAVRSDATCTAGWPDGCPETPRSVCPARCTPRACGAGLSQLIQPRAPATVAARGRNKRTPCAFLCSLVNPSLAFSMTRPEPLPWWARGTAPVRRGCTQVRPRRGGISARAATDGGHT